MKVMLSMILNFYMVSGQVQTSDSVDILLSNLRIQIEATQAINDMYNFQFDDAEKQYRWILQKYPDHPLPYYLLGLSDWWKMMPNIDNPQWDDTFLGYMDTSIEKAELLSEEPGGEVEASFFLAAAYGLKGRLYSERGNWLKAANAGRLALKYQKKHEDQHYLSPEFMFGDALYNYYSVWIRENYPLLKPIMIPFPKGDKDEGIRQLRQVATNAFYTRTEAQLFLMRILALDERDLKGALQVAEYLHETFPDNPYFHRFYARLLYSSGRHKELEQACLDILIRIDSDQNGYEANSGRYASFFLGEYYDARGLDEQAKFYFLRAVEFGDEIHAYETGYYLYSLLRLSQMAELDGDFGTAVANLEAIKKYARKKDRVHKQARTNLKRVRKKQKSAK